MRIRMHIRWNRIQCASNAHWSRSHYFLKFAGDGQVRNNDCTTRVRVKSYAGAVVCCSVLILLFNSAQLCLKYRGIRGEEDSRWLRRHTAKEDGYRFACDIVQPTLFSSWSVLFFNPLQPLVRTLVWTRTFLTPLSRAATAAMIHITQLCNNCLRDYTQSQICEANAHRNHLPRWFHGCELECASTPMHIRVWTLESASNAHYRYCVNRP